MALRIAIIAELVFGIGALLWYSHLWNPTDAYRRERACVSQVNACRGSPSTRACVLNGNVAHSLEEAEHLCHASYGLWAFVVPLVLSAILDDAAVAALKGGLLGVAVAIAAVGLGRIAPARLRQYPRVVYTSACAINLLTLTVLHSSIFLWPVIGLPGFRLITIYGHMGVYLALALLVGWLKAPLFIMRRPRS